MQKLNLRMQKLNFPGTHWRGLALIGAQKNPAFVQISSLYTMNDRFSSDRRRSEDHSKDRRGSTDSRRSSVDSRRGDRSRDRRDPSEDRRGREPSESRRGKETSEDRGRDRGRDDSRYGQ